jgi:transcription antitermination factor NusG
VTQKAEGLPDLSHHCSSPVGKALPNSLTCGTESLWYAVHVKPNFEHVSARLLRDKGFDEYLPVYRSRRRWSDRFKDIDMPLFPRYLFCRMVHSERTQVLSTPGVVAIVACGTEPISVPESEIEAIRIVLRSGLGVQPCPFINLGDRVDVREGPLAGVTGVVIAFKNELLLVVSVPILQRSVSVELRRDWLAVC